MFNRQHKHNRPWDKTEKYYVLINRRDYLQPSIFKTYAEAKAAFDIQSQKNKNLVITYVGAPKTENETVLPLYTLDIYSYEKDGLFYTYENMDSNGKLINNYYHVPTYTVNRFPDKFYNIFAEVSKNNPDATMAEKIVALFQTYEDKNKKSFFNFFPFPWRRHHTKVMDLIIKELSERIVKAKAKGKPDNIDWLYYLGGRYEREVNSAKNPIDTKGMFQSMLDFAVFQASKGEYLTITQSMQYGPYKGHFSSLFPQQQSKQRPY